MPTYFHWRRKMAMPRSEMACVEQFKSTELWKKSIYKRLQTDFLNAFICIVRSKADIRIYSFAMVALR